MTTLEDLAPWPSKQEMSAVSVARSFAVEAYVQAYETHRLCSEASERFRATGHADWAPTAKASDRTFTEFAVVFLLRVLAEKLPDEADEITRELVQCGEDGDLVEWLWDWLEEWGIDPDEVAKLAKQPRQEAA
jgi:hypothetical protein